MDYSTLSQTDFEDLFHKSQLIPRIRREFEEAGLISLMEKHDIPVDFGLDLLVQMQLHRRTVLPVMVGILRRRMDGDCQRTADMILRCVEADLAQWDDEEGILTVLWRIDSKAQAEIDRYQYPLPMIVPPEKLGSNRDTGYLTIRGSVILKDGNHHEGDVCLDHLDRVNAIPLRVNGDTVDMVRNRWKKLASRKEGESREEYRQRRKAFEKYDRVSRDVVDFLHQNEGRFWLTHKYDKRGRTYCQGYHCTYQGNDWNKAAVEFAESEIAT